MRTYLISYHAVVAGSTSVGNFYVDTKEPMTRAAMEGIEQEYGQQIGARIVVLNVVKLEG